MSLENKINKWVKFKGKNYIKKYAFYALAHKISFVCLILNPRNTLWRNRNTELGCEWFGVWYSLNQLSSVIGTCISTDFDFITHYTQNPIIRNGHIRNSAEFWGKFKKRAPKIFKNVEITGTICSNSERSEQFLVTKCFFNLFLKVSQI